jgi:hypothetical protein
MQAGAYWVDESSDEEDSLEIEAICEPQGPASPLIEQASIQGANNGGSTHSESTEPASSRTEDLLDPSLIKEPILMEQTAHMHLRTRKF